jgi:hypothetical protein
MGRLKGENVESHRLWIMFITTSIITILCKSPSPSLKQAQHKLPFKSNKTHITSISFQIKTNGFVMYKQNPFVLFRYTTSFWNIICFFKYFKFDFDFLKLIFAMFEIPNFMSTITRAKESLDIVGVGLWFLRYLIANAKFFYSQEDYLRSLIF